jgi:quercetin dioxygenase-like cupin family protein
VLRYTRLFSDERGIARFEDVEIPLHPDDPPPHVLRMSEPIPAAAVLFGEAPAGGSHPEQPESRRQLMICLSGSGEITASGETRVFRPGDVLLVEDVDGVGHSSSTREGFTVVAVVLSPPAQPGSGPE